MEDLTLEEFDKLSPKKQERLTVRALAWFCVIDSLNPGFSLTAPVEVAVIKIILGKFRGGKG